MAGMIRDKSDAGRGGAQKPAGAARGAAAIERPARSPANAAAFGSDAVADALRSLEIPYIALNPGASFRGLHDSLVNYLGNERPQMLLCLHEEHAVAIAHGYAKVTGRAMAVAVHSNVGLMHATMAIFNAWCDRMPMLILGATGPVDAAKRRPWIDWIHTARDQGALVRPYVKWDDQPASPEAACESLLRAAWLAEVAPKGPTYVNLDAGMQEAKLERPVPAMDAQRYRPKSTSAATPELIAQAAALLAAAKRPFILAGRASRDEQAWRDRVALAEALGARVATDLKIGASFPTDHKLHAGPPGIYPLAEASAALGEADAVLSLDWVDLAGALKSGFGAAPPGAKIIHVSLDHTLHNGWSMDYQALPPVDLLLPADPDAVVPALLDAVRALGRKPAALGAKPVPAVAAASSGDTIHTDDIAAALRAAAGTLEVTFAHLSLGWSGASWHFRHPLDFLGSDGGGGIGAGPGVTVGVALALKGSGRLVAGVCGDGDFLMGATSLWTAVHYKIPLLIVVANNRSFYNDEVHQERMARMRNRPVENKWIGQRMADPEIDMAGLARAQGALGIGPVTRRDKLQAALAEAIAAVEAGGVAVVDVRIEPGATPTPTMAGAKAGR